MNGVLEFYDTSDVVCMNQAEHFMATDVEWDPTGRFVATSVSWWAHKVSSTLQCLLKYRRTSTSSHLSTAPLSIFPPDHAPIRKELFFKTPYSGFFSTTGRSSVPKWPLHREFHCSTLQKKN